MRRLFIAVLTIPLLLTVGCSSRPNSAAQPALDLRAALTQAGGCRFESEIHSDCGGRIYTFCLQYDSKDASVTVTAPETLAGVSAHVEPAHLTLTFDGLALDFGAPQGALTTPLLAPYLLATCLQSGYIASTAQAEQGTAVRYRYGYEDKQLELEVVLDAASLVPLQCELFEDGAVILSAVIRDFALTEQT